MYLVSLYSLTKRKSSGFCSPLETAVAPSTYPDSLNRGVGSYDRPTDQSNVFLSEVSGGEPTNVYDRSTWTIQRSVTFFVRYVPIFSSNLPVPRPRLESAVGNLISTNSVRSGTRSFSSMRVKSSSARTSPRPFSVVTWPGGRPVTRTARPPTIVTSPRPRIQR